MKLHSFTGKWNWSFVESCRTTNIGCLDIWRKDQVCSWLSFTHSENNCGNNAVFHWLQNTRSTLLHLKKNCYCFTYVGFGGQHLVTCWNCLRTFRVHMYVEFFLGRTVENCYKFSNFPAFSQQSEISNTSERMLTFMLLMMTIVTLRFYCTNLCYMLTSFPK